MCAFDIVTAGIVTKSIIHNLPPLKMCRRRYLTSRPRSGPGNKVYLMDEKYNIVSIRNNKTDDDF